MLPFFENLLRKKIERNRLPYDHSVPAWSREFQQNIEMIQREWKQYIDQFHSHGIPIDDLSDVQKSLNEDKKWKSLFLYGYSYSNKQLEKNFPVTFQLIKKWQNELTLVMFSTTEPGKHIPPHTGNNHGVLRLQIGIDISEPEKCTLRVEDKNIQLHEKEMFIFDDTFEHELINSSHANRTVLIIDYYKPLPFLYRFLNKKKISAIAKSDYVQSVINKMNK